MHDPLPVSGQFYHHAEKLITDNQSSAILNHELDSKFVSFARDTIATFSVTARRIHVLLLDRFYGHKIRVILKKG